MMPILKKGKLNVPTWNESDALSERQRELLAQAESKTTLAKPEKANKGLAKLPKGKSSPRKAKARKKPLTASEKEIQTDILNYLQAHSSVAFAFRQNTGGMTKEYKGRKHFIKFAFKGCSDILGMLTDGRFLAVEVKRPGKKATAEQQRFLDNVNDSGGLAFVACSVDDVEKGLGG